MKEFAMNLKPNETERLKNIDIVEQTHIARRDSMQLLDEQGLAALALAVANLLDKILKQPEAIIKEYSTGISSKIFLSYPPPVPKTFSPAAPLRPPGLLQCTQLCQPPRAQSAFRASRRFASFLLDAGLS
jgi:hypothetical protein